MSNRGKYILDIGKNQVSEKKGKNFSQFVSRFLFNLRARQSLLAVIAAVMIFISAVTDVSLALALSGYLIIFISAGALPRRGILRPLVSVRKVQPSTHSVNLTFQPILDAIPDPAMILNVNGLVLNINDKLEKEFDARPLGQHLSSFIRDPDFLDAVIRVSQKGESTEISYTERVPFKKTMNVTISPLRGFGTKPNSPSVLIYFRDLTQQGHLDQMRSDFVANASHELRTPLASVLGFIDTLEGAARNDTQVRDKFMGIMREQVGRMIRLIDDLLSLSQVEMVAHIAPSDVVDLTEVIEYVITTLTPIAEDAKISIYLQAQVDVADVLGHRDELIQLFQNLIQNAIKYGKDGGTVTVVIDRHIDSNSSEATIVASVIDDGPGIDFAHLPRLTERFYRVDVQSSREKGGTGLGLAIVKHIITRHKGELKINSKLGEGSTFKILIPENTN